MKISTSLHIFHNEELLYEEKILRAVKCGFKCLELTCDEKELNRTDWRDVYKNIKTYADSLGVEFYQSHTHFTGKAYSTYTEYDIEKLKKTIEAASIAGAKWTVIHPFPCEDCELEEAVLKNVEIMSPYIELAKSHNIGIAIENMAKRLYWYDEKVTTRHFYNADQLIILCDELSKKYNNVGICWDTGHANLSELNQFDEIRKINKRLKTLHIADNSNQVDEHTIPFMGTVDFYNIVKALKEIDFEGSFNYEANNFTRNLPDDLTDDAVKFMYKVGEKLIK